MTYPVTLPSDDSQTAYFLDVIHDYFQVKRGA